MTNGPDFNQLFMQVAGAEPEELRQSYLATPGAEMRHLGSTVPLLGMAMESRPSGLIAPASRPGQIFESFMRRYLTARELLDNPVTAGRLNVLISGHAREHVLGACAQLMAWLHVEHPASTKTQHALVDRLLVGETAKIAHAAINDDWVLLTPQVVLAVAKLALLADELPELMLPDTSMAHTVEACFGLAQYLGTQGLDDDRSERWWGTLSRPLALELVQNQHFHNGTEVGNLLGRRERLRSLAASHFPDELAMTDQVLLDAAGTTTDVLFHVGFTAWAHVRDGSVVRLARSSFDQLEHPREQVAAALNMLAPNVAQLRRAVSDEFDRTGRFDWSFNVFRRYPMVTLEGGDMFCLSPRFLLDHVTGEGPFWEVRERLNKRKKRSKEGRQDAGTFENFMGHLPEHYVTESLTEMTTGATGLSRRIWTEAELQALWPGLSCCDALLDAGAGWLVFEVFSRHLSEGAAAGDAIDALEAELNFVLTEARQLDATINRLIDAGGTLPGEPTRPAPPRYHPIVVAAAGFPWNPIVAAAIHGRLAEEGLLQHPLIRPLTVIGIDELEEIEGAVTDRRTGLLEFFDARATTGNVGTPVDIYLHRSGLGLRRPPRLDRPMTLAFEHLGAALGLDLGGMGTDAGVA